MNDLGHRGLLVDLDGTIADTLPALRTVYHRFLQQHGASPSDQEFDRLNGVPLPGVVADLRRQHSLGGSTAELLEQYLALVDECYLDAPAAPGARDLLHRASAAGWRCAIVTAAQRDLAERWLCSRALDTLVTALIGAEDVDHPKPAPDPYLAAIAACRVDPRRSIAIDDSELGVQSACAAGLRTFFLSAAEVLPARLEPGIEVITRLADVLPMITGP